jgi:hypothetical protein
MSASPVVSADADCRVEEAEAEGGKNVEVPARKLCDVDGAT